MGAGSYSLQIDMTNDFKWNVEARKAVLCLSIEKQCGGGGVWMHDKLSSLFGWTINMLSKIWKLVEYIIIWATWHDLHMRIMYMCRQAILGYQYAVWINADLPWLRQPTDHFSGPFFSFHMLYTVWINSNLPRHRQPIDPFPWPD